MNNYMNSAKDALTGRVNLKTAVVAWVILLILLFLVIGLPLILTKKSKFGDDIPMPMEPPVVVEEASSPLPYTKHAINIEAPDYMSDFTSTIAKQLTYKDDNDEGLCTTSVSTKPFLTVYLTSLESTQPHRQGLKVYTYPVLLFTIPVSNSTPALPTIREIGYAVSESLRTYNDMGKRTRDNRKFPFEPVVIRLEGDVDPSMVRSRIEGLNITSLNRRNVPVIFKYVQKKNPKRLPGFLFAYIDTVDSKFIDAVKQQGIPPEILEKMAPGTFMGFVRTIYFVNGALSAVDDVDLQLFAPYFISTSTLEYVEAVVKPYENWLDGKSQHKPVEEDVFVKTGCPIPELMPVCPTCEVAKPCPSCPTCSMWDPKKVAPAGNSISIFVNTSTTNNTQIVRTLAELIRVRLAFNNRVANVSMTAVNKGKDAVPKNQIRIKLKTYNKVFTYPTTDAGMRTLIDGIISDITPLLV